MQTAEITSAVHKRERRNSKAKRYALLMLAGVALYVAGAVYAMRERGYFAVGGEALALFLPVLYYVVAAIAQSFSEDRK